MPVDAAQYPINLIVAGRRCLIVGGGEVAQRKAEGLLACDAVVHVVAPSVTAGVKSLPLTWEERPYRRGEAGDYRLVFTATGDGAVDRAVFEDGEAAGVWVNSADDPANCSFTLPALVRQGPLLVTVGTSGHSPALAAWLRDRMEGELGPEYVVLAQLLSEERDAIRSTGQPTDGLDWQKALDSGMLELVRAGRVTEAKERLQACLSSS